MQVCLPRKGIVSLRHTTGLKTFCSVYFENFFACPTCNKVISDYLFCRDDKLTHINKSVHPKFHFCGSVMLLCFISHISRCSLSASNTIIAMRSLSNNLSCFGTSTLCEYVLDSGKQLPSLFFLLLDHIGIILNILVTSVSVLLLENTGSRTSTSIILGVTLAGVVCTTYLITWPREKGERVLEIGVCGALALCSVSLYNAVFASTSRLTASYMFVALVNEI